MTLVHVVMGNLEAERLQHANASDTQNDLLAKAIVVRPAVQLIGDPAILWQVFIEIGIQENDRLACLQRALEYVKPATHPDGAPLDGHGNFRLQ